MKPTGLWKRIAWACGIAGLGSSMAAAAVTVRVVEWNVAHGDAGIPAQVQQIAAAQPDVVLMEEIPAYNPGQADQYTTLLQQQTGQTWHAVLAVHNLNGSGDADMLLSRFPLTASGTHSLGPSSFGDMRNSTWAAINFSGSSVTFFGIHLDWPSDTFLQQNMTELLSFAGGFNGPKVISGDFNSWYNGNTAQKLVTAQIRQTYTDSFVEFFGSDAASPNTITNGWRPDSLYHNTGITTTSVAVNSASQLSDHFMVTVVLSVTGATGPSACDINTSGATDVADVQAEINQAIGAAACQNDVHQDGICNIVDVQRVVNAALGEPCLTP